jgi:hypothetical protein
MDHAMTVRAQKTKVLGLCFIAWFQRVNGPGVMALYEAFTVLPIALAEVKPAGFARQLTKHGQRTPLLSLHQSRVALVTAV